MKEGILVVGSCNIDLTFTTKKLPERSETVMGTNFYTSFGGKGANQAVACAKAAGKKTMVTMLAMLGDDDHGSKYKKHLEDEMISTQFLKFSDISPTGVASVCIDKNGDNQIIVIGGSNMELSPKHIEQSSKIFECSRVCLVQNEIPYSTILAALKKARDTSMITIYNAAPAPVNLSDLEIKDLLDLTSILVVNQTEASTLTRSTSPLLTDNEIKLAALKLLEIGSCDIVIITLGAKGALVLQKKLQELSNGVSSTIPLLGVDNAIMVECPFVEHVVDTVGAGDCFCGTLAFYIDYRFRKSSLTNTNGTGATSTRKLVIDSSIILQGVAFANDVASKSIESKGLHDSYVTGEIIDKLMEMY